MFINCSQLCDKFTVLPLIRDNKSSIKSEWNKTKTAKKLCKFAIMNPLNIDTYL